MLMYKHGTFLKRETEIYTRRPCIVLQRGIVGRVPGCKNAPSFTHGICWL